MNDDVNNDESTESQIERTVTERVKESVTFAKMRAVVDVVQVVGFPFILLLVGYVFNTFVDGQARLEQAQGNLNTRVSQIEIATQNAVAQSAREMDKALNALSSRVTTIEASRFKLSDAVAIQESISQLWVEMTLRVRQEDVPAQWLVDKVNDLNNQLQKLRDRVDEKLSGGGAE